MPKGRNFAPSIIRDGIWFQHHLGNNEYINTSLDRSQATTTGLFHHESLDPASRIYPGPPPERFIEKDSGNFKWRNEFSEHDQRHALQDVGEYFGDGRSERLLGRKLLLPVIRRQHTSDVSTLHHDGKVFYEYLYNTEYGDRFATKEFTDEKMRRRFRRQLPLTRPGTVQLETNTTSWSSEDDYVPLLPIKVMANSQVPYLRKRDSWKYSYNKK